MEPRRAGALAFGFSLAGVVLVVLVLGIAAGVGPSGLTHGRAHDALYHAPSPPPPSSSPHGHHPPPLALPHGQSSVPFAGAIGLVVRLALMAWLVWLVLKGLLWLKEELESWRHREPPVPEIDFDVLDDPEPLVQEMRRDADDQLALLLGGEPRNAIVACWERFEEQAERAGLARRPWETSSEFTLRLLEVVSADSTAVARLAVLYREARFSDHLITEDSRQLALQALDRIRETVGTARTVRP
jgi:ABC-type transporter Mla MlaB component